MTIVRNDNSRPSSSLIDSLLFLCSMTSGSCPAMRAPMKALFPRLVVILGIFVLFHPSVMGQAVSGNIIGTVTDASGAAIGKAPVTITDLDRGATYKTTANESGNYEQTHLLAGRYKVSVTAPGLNPFQETPEIARAHT